MQDAKMKSDIDELLNELNCPSSPTTVNTTPQTQIQAPIVNNTVNAQELRDFVVQQSAKLLLSNINLMDNLRLKLLASNDPDLINSFSSLVNSTSKSLKELNSLVLQEEKAKIAREISENKSKNAPQNQTNIFFGSREDAFDHVIKKVKESNVIDLDNDVEGMKAPPKPVMLQTSDETPQSEES